MQTPLPLPDSYNPDTYLHKNVTENGIFHESRQGAAFADSLAANGAEQDLELAEKVLEVVLSCQERDTRDPHVGNFYWMLEDNMVQDLNAVQFNLEHLIPMMLNHGERLTPPNACSKGDSSRALRNRASLCIGGLHEHL